MNRFRGLNDDGASSRKLSRDDDQLLALNYENLCDLDYLVRLLAEDGLVEAGVSLEAVRQGRGGATLGGLSSSLPAATARVEPFKSTGQASGGSFITQGWNLTPDLPEDLILFGDLPALGMLANTSMIVHIHIRTLYSTPR